MNEFVSWCRHLLVSFLFHALTSLHPPSFHRNDFSTCSTHYSFILVQSLKMFSLRSAHVDFMHAHLHAENLHVHTRKWRRSVSAPRSTIEMYGERKTNARFPFTPQSTVETLGEEISAEACSGKEIAGLLRKIMIMIIMMMNMMSQKLWNRVWMDSRVANWRQVGTS